jgi:hypothetical protein
LGVVVLVAAVVGIIRTAQAAAVVAAVGALIFGLVQMNWVITKPTRLALLSLERPLLWQTTQVVLMALLATSLHSRLVVVAQR